MSLIGKSFSEVSDEGASNRRCQHSSLEPLDRGWEGLLKKAVHSKVMCSPGHRGPLKLCAAGDRCCRSSVL